LFSAIQNSTAGHAVFASMPIIMLVLAIAGPGQKTEESELVLFGLKILLLTLAVQASTVLLLIAIC
jgi:lactate permease